MTCCAYPNQTACETMLLCAFDSREYRRTAVHWPQSKLTWFLGWVQTQVLHCLSSCQKKTPTQTALVAFLLWQRTACFWQSTEPDCPPCETQPTVSHPSGYHTNPARPQNAGCCMRRRRACPIDWARFQTKPFRLFGAR